MKLYIRKIGTNTWEYVKTVCNLFEGQLAIAAYSQMPKYKDCEYGFNKE